MLGKLHKYLTVGLVLALVAVLGYGKYRQDQLQGEMTDLHNQIARQAETIEVKDDIYRKATQEIEALDDVVRAMGAENKHFQKTITDLRKELKKRGEQLLAATQLAAKWKKAYEDEANAHQEEEPPVNPGDPPRVRVIFEKDFGYIGVEGYTLTNPAYAWVRVQQNRALQLVLTLSQRKDGGWNTHVASSEDNVGVDIQLSAVNPYLFRGKWYAKLSVDIGMQIDSSMFPYVGLSYVFDNGIYLSAGAWGTDQEVGPYGTIGYSWRPFAR